MSEDKSTHDTHGFIDHHHLKKAQPIKIDPNYRADRKTMDTVWAILQGHAVPADAPLAPGQQEIEVPYEYVDAIAFFALQELKRRGSGKGFSVKRGTERPEVEITWQRPGGLVTGSGNGYAQTTDCLAAHIAELDPPLVGQTAAVMFLERLETAIQSGIN